MIWAFKSPWKWNRSLKVHKIHQFMDLICYVLSNLVVAVYTLFESP